jgi:putative membrane protein insertion efficiency factor
MAKTPVSNGLVRLYRKVLSPILHAVFGPAYGCRFIPTCSQYVGDALEAHGLMKGGILGLKRICRCHPWGGSGYDPVPGSGNEGKYGS